MPRGQAAKGNDVAMSLSVLDRDVFTLGRRRVIYAFLRRRFAGGSTVGDGIGRSSDRNGLVAAS